MSFELNLIILVTKIIRFSISMRLGNVQSENAEERNYNSEILSSANSSIGLEAGSPLPRDVFGCINAMLQLRECLNV